MKAALFHAKEDLRIEDVPEPTPGPDRSSCATRMRGSAGRTPRLLLPPRPPDSISTTRTP